MEYTVLSGYAPALLVLATAASYYYLSSQAKKDRRPRSMSFSSQAMIFNAFPESSAVAPPIVNILFLYKKCPTKEKLVEAAKLLMFYDRFRCMPVLVPGTSQYEFVECEQSSEPASFVTSERVSNEEEMKTKIDMICADTYSLSKEGVRPLWSFVRIENAAAGELHAVIVRVHHVIGDGISLVETMSKLFKLEDGKDFKLDLSIGGGAKGSRSLNLKTAASLAKAFVEVLTLATSPFDSNLPFSHTYPKDRSELKMSSKRKTVYFPTFKIDFIKSIKNKATESLGQGVTINDVIFSATAGAILRYSERVEASSAAKRSHLRALMPVAFPRKDLESPHYALRNKWAFVSAELPMNPKGPVDRLIDATKMSNSLKSKPNAGVQMWVQSNLLPLLPRFLARKTAQDIFSRHSIVFSNVRGPETSLQMCGESLVGLQVIFPNILPQTLAISYGGGLFYNMSIDAEAMAGADELLPKLFYEELLALADKFGVSSAKEDVLYKPTKSAMFFGDNF